MKHPRWILLPAMLALAACQVGLGPASVLPAPVPEVLPSSAPTTSPSATPTQAPTATPTEPSSPLPSAPMPVPYTSLLDRDSESQSEQKTRVIDTQAAFDQYWSAHGGNTPKPAIDFAQQTVVAVYRHEAPYASLGYEIVLVTQADRVVSVHYRQRTQQPGRAYLPVISYPVHAVSIPLSRQDGDFDRIDFVEDAPQPVEQPPRPAAS